MSVVIRNGKVVSITGGSVVTSGNLVVSGDVVRGRTIIGDKVSHGGNVIQVDGMTIITGGEAPEVHQEHDGVRSVTLSECDNVTLATGDKFKIDGHGSCNVSGGVANISGFTGTVQLPSVDDVEINLSSGSINGTILASSISARVTSGDVRIRMQSRDKSPRINASCTSGDISITVL